MNDNYKIDTYGLTLSGDLLVDQCHGASVKAGWYTDPATGGLKERNVGEMLALIHSEVSEALEGARKNLMDDHLPQYPMVIVELADAAIRIGDLVGYLQKKLGVQVSFGEVIATKMTYNSNRADHKLENRAAAGGKAF